MKAVKREELCSDAFLDAFRLTYLAAAVSRVKLVGRSAAPSMNRVGQTYGIGIDSHGSFNASCAVYSFRFSLPINARAAAVLTVIAGA